MVFSHHSHSGEFVLHAVDTLSEVVDRAKQLDFRVFCLTEHCPRYARDVMYPEESDISVANLSTTFDKYVTRARELQKSVNCDKSSRLKILVGFESEGGIDDAHFEKYQNLRARYNMEIVVGSVHYINRIPIDFDKELWLEAKAQFKTFKEFYLAYFDAQYEVIQKLKPEVVSHFDLIRLFESGDKERCEITEKYLKDIDIEKDWPEVWAAIGRNLDLINEQGGMIELNSAAIRKGWDTPYPKQDIMLYALSKSTKFCMSDDSHGVSQVGLNYSKVLKYIQSFGDKLCYIYFLDLDDRGNVFVNKESVANLAKDPFWNGEIPSTS